MTHWRVVRFGSSSLLVVTNRIDGLVLCSVLRECHWHPLDGRSTPAGRPVIPWTRPLPPQGVIAEAGPTPPSAGITSRQRPLRTAQRSRASSSIVDVFLISKLLRANGECLGAYYRRRTWTAAISHGELPIKLRSVDVRIGKPGTRHGVPRRSEHIGPAEGTG